MTNSEEEKYDLIERYVNRLLSKEEQESFESEMAQDPELKREVEAYTEAQELVLDQGILNVKLKIQEIHRVETGKANARKYYLPGAVLVIVSATLLYLYFTSNSKPTVEKNIATVSDSAKVEQNIATNADQTTATETATPINPAKGNNNGTQQSTVKDNTSLSKKDSVQTTSAPDQADQTSDAKDTKVTTTTPAITNLPPAAFDCASITITGNATAKETCKDEANGNIIIDLGSIKGGTKPYKYSLEKEDTFRSTSQFTDLAAGQYQVFVKDKNNCLAEIKKVEVTSKFCAKDEAFKPGYEEWNIPVKEDFNGELRILNRANDKVYSAFIKHGSPATWNGNDTNGMPLPAGVYLYTIISENGEVIQGTVSILK